jgi:hypothetical protein
MMKGRRDSAESEANFLEDDDYMLDLESVSDSDLEDMELDEEEEEQV